MRVKCDMCGEEMDADLLGAYQRVEGWEVRNRKGGGTNSLRMREPKHRYAHKTCVEEASRGRRGQASLGI